MRDSVVPDQSILGIAQANLPHRSCLMSRLA